MFLKSNILSYSHIDLRLKKINKIKQKEGNRIKYICLSKLFLVKEIILFLFLIFEANNLSYIFFIQIEL